MGTLKWLASFVLNFVGFATNGFTGGDFAFIAKLTFDSQPHEYKFNYNMQKDGSILKLATKVFTESVQKAFNAVWDWIKAEVKSCSRWTPASSWIWWNSRMMSQEQQLRTAASHLRSSSMQSLCVPPHLLMAHPRRN